MPQPYDEDVWMQDEFEFAHAISGSGRTVDIVIDSIRDRGLDDYAEYSLMNANTGVAVFGSGVASSEDSFGNLETTPPCVPTAPTTLWVASTGATAAGLSRAAPRPDRCAGAQRRRAVRRRHQLALRRPRRRVHELRARSVRPKGFRLVFTNTDLGMNLIDSVPRSMPCRATPATRRAMATPARSRPTARCGPTTTTSKTVLRPILDKLRSELDLDAADILEVRRLRARLRLRRPRRCPRARHGQLRRVHRVAKRAHQGLHPRPFFRSDIYSQRDDVFIDAFNQLLPPSLDLYYVDDWDTYHLMQGEVHCGSNTRRSPPNVWWKDAAHLMGGL